ncbi:CusA/CzcA family heavy metal efflux RND transporter [Sessilibacter sp. MAH1]
MIEKVIYWSIQNRVLVLLATVILSVGGLYSVKNTPVDAIPDLSDVQVIIKTSYPGQAPQVVQDQVTYPLTTAMLSVPGAQTVRGFSFFGDSYVYIIFEDKTDLYWARSRVLEYLNQVAPQLPANASPQLGPDATGVGWVYLYALIDKTGQHDINQLRSLQDWFLKFELQSVPGVAEVATVGGMVKQYQVEVDPERLRAFDIPLTHIQNAIRQANQEVGASVIELAEAEYVVRASGYLKSEQDLSNIPLGVSGQGTPLLLKDVATISVGPQMRRGISEFNGLGESVGGIVVMRFGENAQQTIDAVKEKIEALKSSLPAGVELVPVYDRSELITSAIDNLWQKLAEELIMVAVVCIVFLMHLRSSLVAMISLPIGILTAFIVMHWQGLNANIMSLGGIAIAIGAMIDGAIVMIENLHKHLEDYSKNNIQLTNQERWNLVAKSSVEVGPGLFFSLLIITVSFLPVFTLEAQEGKMFAPLAYTKTFAMAASAALAVTLVPVLMGYFVRGRIRTEQENPINRFLMNSYRPLLKRVLKFPKLTLAVFIGVLISGVWPLFNIGSEFMPELNEGDLMYMPTTYPGVSIGKAREILQQTDKLIKTVPEVKTVFGKIGRAETATDPAPLTMIETFIQFKDKSEWRDGLTFSDLKSELESIVQVPGLTNAWVMPIKTRIDMLATGIKTPVGLKIAGPNLKTIQGIGEQVENLLGDFPGTASVYSERVAGGRYLEIDLKREQAVRFGLNIDDIQQVISTAVGGVNITQTVEGLERYPVNIRYPQAYRDSPEKLELLPIVTESGQRIALADVADIKIVEGPPNIKSENARVNGWVFIDVAGVDLGTYVTTAKDYLNENLDLPVGYSVTWSGQFEYLERAKEKLTYVIPLTIAIIIVLLYLNFKSFTQVTMLLLTLPVALVGSLWLMYILNFNFSIAAGVGLIALAGVAAETGVIMLVYLNQAFKDHVIQNNNQQKIGEGDDNVILKEYSKNDIAEIIVEGASKRVRPVIMTAGATVIGLVPILYGTGTGSEVMSRLAAPMVGGMLTTILLTLFVLPVVYLLVTKSVSATPVMSEENQSS